MFDIYVTIEEERAGERKRKRIKEVSVSQRVIASHISPFWTLHPRIV